MSDGPPILYESWATAVERYELLRVEADALRSQVERLAHAMLDSDMPRWDADRLVIEQGWNTPDRCGRCGEVNPQVERYREALEQIANEDNCDSTCWGCGEWGTACRSTTTDTYPCAQALARDAIARLDADPPREPEA